MQRKSVSNGIALMLGLAMTSLAPPANAASTCSAMFDKAEKMVAGKSNIDIEKRIDGYQMAIGGYRDCTKALAMAQGTPRDSMMKKAERTFGDVYRLFGDAD